MAHSSQMLPANIVIAGGGYVGLLAAIALKATDSQLSVRLVEPRGGAAPPPDWRASAVAAAARKMLEQLGVWSDLCDQAEPIIEMEITDSRLRDAARPVFLTFETAEDGAGPLAHMVENTALVRALQSRARTLGVEFLPADSVTDFRVSGQGGAMVLALKKHGELQADLLIAADGLRSQLRQIAGIKTLSWAYEQSGIITTLRHGRSHHGRAEEHFLPAGPFAVLPLAENRVSLVWTENRADAERIVAADDASFRHEVIRRLGRRLGEISDIGPRARYPLSLSLARDYVRPRFALIGDAAHGIHPIAGQGLNLGFKDAAALAQTIVAARRLGQDIGAIDVLENYQRWRRFDNWRMGMTTDVINRLFSNDNDLLRGARDFGLALVDRLPIAKRAFIREAGGLSMHQPRLLKGQPI